MQDDNRTLRQELPGGDGIGRRGMLKCMAWVGTGLIWGMSGGIATSRVFGQAPTVKPTFTFAQISDSHLGFSRDPNKDVAGTLKKTIARINERGGSERLLPRNTRFANINNGPKRVWWIDIPLKMVSPKSKSDVVHLLLYQPENDQLHHLAVPVDFLWKNRGPLVTRDDKQVISLELSTESSSLFTDLRATGGRVSFAQFRQSTD